MDPPQPGEATLAENTMSHDHTIIQQFSLQAGPFAELPGHSDALQLLIQCAGAAASDVVLDVACGPGLVACAFAEHVAHVTGIDITPNMIGQATKRQHEKNLQNVAWHIGTVLPLPFPDAQFSIVVTRYSFHHFLDPMAVLLEMVRVCQPGGKVLVVDAVLPAEKAAAYNRMEKLRDPSHTQALSVEEMSRMVHASGLRHIRTTRYMVEMELETQLAASFPNPGDDEKLRQLVMADIGHDSLGVGAHRVGRDIHFAYPILITVGEKVAD
jgi:ubiquinone/menaquinone biosynthesis C-methylase UbiE